ncbi:MAG: type I phosphomannose isomerase catalytic subunit [Ruminococcus sp.]
MNEPVFLKGVCKDYLWGGNRLRQEFGKESDRPIIAESWELSCHPDGCCVVMNGRDAGLTLTEYMEKYGAERILGANCHGVENVPLIKLIDAKEPLSVQVHPDDAYARAHGDTNGKTEMWYIVDAEPDAKLVYGVNRALTREGFARHIADGTLEEILNEVPVKKGDVFFIPAGTLHAIGKGILLAEVQQNSNLTYRVYDYNRRDAEGNLRELHIEDAVAVTDLVPVSEAYPHGASEDIKSTWGTMRILSICRHFAATCYTVTQQLSFTRMDSFRHLLVLEGEGILKTECGEYPLKKGDSVLLPAGMGGYWIDGHIRFIETFCPDIEEQKMKTEE